MENFPSDNQSDLDCLLAFESVEFCLQLEKENEKLKKEQGGAYRKSSDVKTEIDKFFKESEDDNLCAKAAEEAEKKNSDPVAGTSVDPSLSSTLYTIKNVRENEEKPKWSIAVMNRLKELYRSNPTADLYAAEMFFPLTSWPDYMVELFVLSNIANYSYSTRNKICLFFWGNGGTLEILNTFSGIYAPKLELATQEQQRQYNESWRKCEGLFKTYTEQCLNPAYFERYYYYSLMENRMLYIDGRPRHFGRRQEDSGFDPMPAWANARLR